MTDDEARWIARAGAGDAVAFRRLVDAHAGALYRVCARITGDKAVAEDAVQEAFFNAWRHLRDFDGRAAFATWLHRIAVNAALEQLRRRGRVETALPDGEEAEGLLARTLEAQPGPERVARSAELRRGIEGELARMSVLERSAFVLRHHEGRSLEDIAAALSLNVGACKQAIFRAVRKLRAVLEPELP
ncbi:RNA polymerase sigma factor [Dokdonella fugitiva]|jgi:RNA polymerase sigma-70 factor (ECF subfamily)|uniref:RNA polymerase sigma-70 factor (ECF subfamily) n=1 Tax=Dokdonella fugitiva TaxID=328517 RepID=A0A4R2I7K2_9GAMM|nr:sigma-70 family RNA polymerase sigma factor [Dokdonella fugitiva]MBA8883249.1 RNA polymerase sigma-70 factor (ECF subfamily) [Dokdonella fugitiva]TCO40294.1 RNA polymerase sigma-70 factor (ECF subfamily) [Dokdonella fugitiva]